MNVLLITPETYHPSSKVEVDVCIIGSGAGGSIAAAKIVNKGYSVVILEKGPHVNQSDFTQRQKEIVPRLYEGSGAQATDDLSMAILQGSVYGGSTTINWMTSLATPDYVLDQWVNQFKLNEYDLGSLQRHSKEVSERLRVHRVDESSHNPQNLMLLKGSEKLGFHAYTSYNNSVNCIGCGHCGLGCTYNAKQDMRLTYLQDALSQGIDIFTSTKASKIKYKSSSKQVIHAVITLENDRVITFEVHTRKTIVSASAIATPLLLQKSKLTAGGTVGKHLQLHPVSGVFGIFEDKMYPTSGIPQSVVVDEYLNMDGNGYGFWLETPDLEPFLAGAYYPGMGIERREELKQLNNMGVIITLVRDGANGKSTVSNGEVRWRRGFNLQNGSFSLGLVPSIRYKISKPDLKHLLKGLEVSVKIALASGAKRVQTVHNQKTDITNPVDAKIIHSLPSGPNQLGMFSAHPTGTSRMGKDSKSSVVDQTCEMHNYPGVFVMDGSIVPTAPGVNPMITILSMVSRAIEIGEW